MGRGRKLPPLLVACLAVSWPCQGQAVLVSAGGPNAGDKLGASVCRVADRDGDGQDDLAVGSPCADNGAILDAGRLALLSSQDGTELGSFSGGVPSGRLGQAVIELTDLTGDGVPELAVGEPGTSGAAPKGRVLILNGATLLPTGNVDGPSAGARLGERLVLLADLTGDGVPELAASAPGHTAGFSTGAGAVQLINPVGPTVVRTLVGGAAFDGFGTGLGRIGDLSGDDRPELVVGSPGADPSGMVGAGLVEVIDPMTAAVLRSIPGPAPAQSTGFACDGLLDLSGDGTPDVVAGAPAASPGGRALSGMTYVFSGSDGQLLAFHVGATSGDGLGRVVGSLGDLDGDGLGDYASGSPLIQVGALSGAGRLEVYSGGSSSLLYRFDGEASWQGRGGAVTTLADLDLDGRPDFAVGSPAADGAAGVDAGRVEIHRGQAAALRLDTTGRYGTPFTLTLQATPGKLAFLLIDTAAGPVQSPFGELCVGLSPSLDIVFLGALDQGGLLSSGGVLPPSGPPGMMFYLQSVVQNPFPAPAAWAGECYELTLLP